VGKSVLSEQVAEAAGLESIDVGEVAKQLELYNGYDSAYGCHVLNEERVIKIFQFKKIHSLMGNCYRNDRILRYLSE